MILRILVWSVRSSMKQQEDFTLGGSTISDHQMKSKAFLITFKLGFALTALSIFWGRFLQDF
eukprot:708685-Amphidinium_carterae.1